MERVDSLDTSDIEGASSRRLPMRHTPHIFNSNDDISGSRPYSRSLDHRSRRMTDTLNPQYALASVAYEPYARAASAPRDMLWTLPQTKWVAETRAPPPMGEKELYHRDFLYYRHADMRQANRTDDVCGPQFRIEEKRWRKTNPLQPAYYYDGGPIEDVKLRRNRYGSMYPRAPAEAYALRTDDIVTDAVATSREYPKELIKTRVANRIDDITGAQHDTLSFYPKLWRARDPAAVPEKRTNRVKDIEGAVAGSGGQGLLLYRQRKQAAMATPPPTASAAARHADILSVHALK
jgi:hypothetical protein